MREKGGARKKRKGGEGQRAAEALSKYTLSISHHFEFRMHPPGMARTEKGEEKKKRLRASDTQRSPNGLISSLFSKGNNYPHPTSRNRERKEGKKKKKEKKRRMRKERDHSKGKRALFPPGSSFYHQQRWKGGGGRGGEKTGAITPRWTTPGQSLLKFLEYSLRIHRERRRGGEEKRKVKT